jgi:surface antigen
VRPSHVSHNALGAFAQIFLRSFGVGATLLGAGLLGGCSIVMPPSPKAEDFRAQADDVTFSIKRSGADLPRELDAEDKRRAFAALATALDPQGDGAVVNWENPETGARGGFTPVGHAYPIDGKVCRAFLAEVGSKQKEERLQGTACRERTNDWTISEIGPWRRG